MNLQYLAKITSDMSEAEAAFLREQVLRLNNELARAQNRPALTHEEGEEAAPWLASSEHLPPLLSAVLPLAAPTSGATALTLRAY